MKIKMVLLKLKSINPEKLKLLYNGTIGYKIEIVLFVIGITICIIYILYIRKVKKETLLS